MDEDRLKRLDKWAQDQKKKSYENHKKAKPLIIFIALGTVYLFYLGETILGIIGIICVASFFLINRYGK